MEEAKVSELPVASTINDDDIVMIVQNGFNKQITKEDLFNDTEENIESLQTELADLQNETSNLIEYTTDEIAVGKWIDGKTIYRKVIEVTSGFNTLMQIPHGITNLDSLVDVRGWHKTVGFKPLPTIYLPNISNYGASIYTIDAQNIELTLSSWVVQNTTKFVIIIEYTKATG